MGDFELYLFDLAIRALTDKTAWAFILTWLIILPAWTLLNIGASLLIMRIRRR